MKMVFYDCTSESLITTISFPNKDVAQYFVQNSAILVNFDMLDSKS